MKKIYFALSLLTATVMFSQTTIYSENFGTPTSTTALSAYNGYQQSAPILYTGTADVRNTTSSTGYTNASGNGSVFVAGTVTPARYIIIEGINTLDFTNIGMSFGHQKTTNASSNELTVEVSSDGTNWTMLNYTRATGNSLWVLITPTGVIPSTANLRIKFTNPTTSNAGFRIDDIKLTGTASSLSVESVSKDTFKIYPTLVSNGKIYISSSKNKMMNVKIYDQSSKLIMSAQTQKEVNVSTLEKGVYSLNIEEDGVLTSKRIVIN